ncbi:MAG TPA: hypothetical protein VFX72_05010 [Usitatibacteraceae bacterium]|nr:hypothetical protein [Usitatibacteraceae bacterium]
MFPITIADFVVVAELPPPPPPHPPRKRTAHVAKKMANIECSDLKLIVESPECAEGNSQGDSSIGAITPATDFRPAAESRRTETRAL